MGMRGSFRSNNIGIIGFFLGGGENTSPEEGGGGEWKDGVGSFRSQCGTKVKNLHISGLQMDVWDRRKKCKHNVGMHIMR